MIWLPGATHQPLMVSSEFKEGVHERQRTPLPTRQFENLDRLALLITARLLLPIEKLR